MEPSSTSIFDFPERSTDWSLAIINYLFRPEQAGAAGFQIFSSDNAQAALTAALAFYSHAVLVIAGVMLLYHLVTIITETAHTGRPMGRANAIWGPIRLVVAIGLLVPLAGGLNSGQLAVIQLAEWGSGLASQTWKVFLDNLGEQKFAYKPVPPPSIAPVVAEALKIRVCERAYNDQLARYELPGGDIQRYQMRQIPLNGAMTEGFYVGNDFYERRGSCGVVEFGKPATSRSSGSQAISNQIATQQREVFLNQAWPRIGEAAATIYANPQNFTVREFTALVEAYQTALREGMGTAQTQLQAEDEHPATTLSRNQGWVSAGSFFSEISRRQGSIFNAALSVPNLTGPTLPTESETVAAACPGPILGNVGCRERRGLVNTARANNDSTANGLESAAWLRLNPAQQVIDRELNKFLELNQAEMGRSSSITPNAALMEDTAKLIDSNANTSNRWSAINWLLNQLNYVISVGLDWNPDPDSRLGFRFNESENPLAELVYFGQRKINTAVLIIAGGAIAAGASSFVAPALGAFLAGIAGFFATIMLLAGVTLAFVVPLLPFIKFFFNVLTWILSLLEAVVAIPLFALAHLNPYGEGYMGSAKSGYLFLFNIMLRPVLMIFGLVVGFLLFMVGVTLLNNGYEYAVSRSLGYGGNYEFFTKVAFSVIYAALVYICANNCFKGIDLFPSQALRWMGEGGQTTIPMGDPTVTNAATGALAAYMLNQSVGTALRGGTNLGGKGHEARLINMGNNAYDAGVSGAPEPPKPRGLDRFVYGGKQRIEERFAQGRNDREQGERSVQQIDALQQIATELRGNRTGNDDNGGDQGGNLPPQPGGGGGGGGGGGPRPDKGGDGGAKNERSDQIEGASRRSEAASAQVQQSESSALASRQTAGQAASSSVETANKVAKSETSATDLAKLGSEATRRAEKGSGET